MGACTGASSTTAKRAIDNANQQSSYQLAKQDSVICALLQNNKST